MHPAHGAVEHLWFQIQWPESWATVSITPKELVPIVVGVTPGQRICLCDNTAMVAAMNKGTAKDPVLSHLLRVLALVAATPNLNIVARHLPSNLYSKHDGFQTDRTGVAAELN